MDYLAKAKMIKDRRQRRQQNVEFSMLEKKEKNAEKMVVKEFHEKNF